MMVLGVPAQVELQLAEREAELAQCREQLQRTEQLLNKARNAAALAPVPKKSSSTPAAVAAAVPAPPQEITAKPDGKLSSTAGCGSLPSAEPLPPFLPNLLWHRQRRAHSRLLQPGSTPQAFLSCSQEQDAGLTGALNRWRLLHNRMRAGTCHLSMRAA